MMPVINAPSAEATHPPKQYSQPSRKGKKSWRKNVDVTEVEKGLQDLNEQIIRGGVIKEKVSSELFTIDVKGEPKHSKNLPKHIKGLKADQIIAQRSATAPVLARKRPGDKTTDGLIHAKRQRTDWVLHKELARLRKVADGQHESALIAKTATCDIWDVAAEPNPSKPNDFLPEQQRPKVPKTMKQPPISMTASGKHVRAVQKPTGGFSYNPAFAEYEARLAEEGAKALEAEKKRLAAEEASEQKKEAVARSAAEAEAAEKRANMSEWEEDSEWEGFQSGVEDEKPSGKQPKRKTQAQRNRIARRKEEERLAKHNADMKQRRVQEHRIKQIVQELDEREQNRALAVASDMSTTSDEVTDEKLRRKQLGKFRLPDRDLELVLPDELQESLRLLKPEGNLLKDRYRSMLVRGKMESRRHIPFKKQARRKLTEKWTYKDFIL